MQTEVLTLTNLNHLRDGWLPSRIYDDADYRERVVGLRRRRYYGQDSADKAGILRYTKVTDTLIDLADIPAPDDERELAWLLSFYWHVDRTYDSLSELTAHRESSTVRIEPIDAASTSTP